MAGSLCPDEIAQQEFESVHAVEEGHIHWLAQEIPHAFGRKEGVGAHLEEERAVPVAGGGDFQLPVRVYRDRVAFRERE